MNDIQQVLTKWQLDPQTVRRLVYTAENARERERWHAVWLMTQGWTAVQVAKALERDAHTIGEWMENLSEKGAEGLMFEQSGGSPRPQRGTGSGIERGGPRSAGCGWGGAGEMDVEGGPGVSQGEVRVLVEQQQLPELPAPAGICGETA